MIADAGLEVLQMDGAGHAPHHPATPGTAPAAVPGAAPVAAPAAHEKQEKKVAIRTRGAGTSEPANA